VRHASLVALSRTLYDVGSLEKRGADDDGDDDDGAEGGGRRGKKGKTDASDPTLLRALSERVLDVDVPCATVAVGCLSNFVNFCHSRGDREGGEEGGEDVASAVLVPILMQRVRLTSALVSSMTTMTTSSSSSSSSSSVKNDDDKRQLRLREQWTLLSLSLSTLAGLIENRPRSILSDADGGGHANVPLARGLLSALDLAKGAVATTSRRAEVGREEGAGTDPIAESAANAARALHSLLDDNPSLVGSVLSSREGGGGTTAAASSPPPSDGDGDGGDVASRLAGVVADGRLPNAARLHACGSILAMRRAVVLGGDKRLASRLQSLANDVVVPHLSSVFDVVVVVGDVARDGGCGGGGCITPESFDSDTSRTTPAATTTTTATIKHILGRMISLSNQLSSVKDDESMEMQAVSRVKARGESARSIARRLQETKKAKKTKTKAKDRDLRGAPGGMMQVDGEEWPRACNDATGGEENGKIGKDDAVMVVELDDGDDEEGDGGDGDKDRTREQAEDELREELDAVVSAWRDIVGTQKLALELVANLCSGSNEDDDEEEDVGDDDDDEGMYGENDDDEDEKMWDSDDEARLLSTSVAASNDARPDPNKNDSAIAQFERETYESMADLPMKILRFFRHWVDFPSAFAAASTAMDSATPDEGNNGSIVADVGTEASSKTACLPALVSRDIDEVLSTCALCLGNVVACNLLADGSSGAGADEEKININYVFWRELASMLEGDDHNHHRHVTSVMLPVLLRIQPQARIALVETTTLDRLISLLLSQHHGSTPDTTAAEDDDGKIYDDEAILQMQRIIISLLGTLCTSAHLETIDTKVCRALLSRLTLAVSSGDGTPLVGGDGRERQQQQQQQQQHHDTTMTTARNFVIITHETLNVLMDMYGNDDCHERVFVNECVLDHIRKCLPWFKRTIKNVVAKGGVRSEGNPVEEEGFVWNETALNATRFIKYKQGK